MPKRKKKHSDGFSFDFSALTFGQSKFEDETEIPKLCTEPAAFENAEAMADRIDYDKDYFALVSGNFIFGDFIEALCFKKMLVPSEIYITTLGMSQDNVDSIVYDSREQWDGSIRRRRKCVVCGTRFLTVEKFEKILAVLDIEDRSGDSGVPSP